MNRKGIPHKFHIPVKRLYEIHKMLDDMPDSDNPMYNRNKEILKLVFIEGLTPAEISRRKIFFSQERKPISVRRVQQIVLEYVPDWYECRRKPQTKTKKIRSEQTKIKRNVFCKENIVCAKCGEKSNLELDHILPIQFGGDNSPENLQLLCHDCHRVKTQYERKIKERSACDA